MRFDSGFAVIYTNLRAMKRIILLTQFVICLCYCFSPSSFSSRSIRFWLCFCTCLSESKAFTTQSVACIISLLCKDCEKKKFIAILWIHLIYFLAICHQLNGIQFVNFAGFSHRINKFLRALICSHWTRYWTIQFQLVVHIVFYERHTHFFSPFNSWNYRLCKKYRFFFICWTNYIAKTSSKETH